VACALSLRKGDRVFWLMHHFRTLPRRRAKPKDCKSQRRLRLIRQ